ncbi:MAG: sigma-70 family RNA polymerase sigma factor [Ignavibacteria bacterium]|nr:sigma-70 family RNA polymerase sigma factor [Ignavibacteria bacterium]
MTGGLLNIDSDDFEIIESFKNGNERAFNLLVSKYQKKVYWIVRKMVLDHDEANDITQDIFIKIYSSLKEFRGESKFFTYIYKISVNFSLNHLNKKSRTTNKHTDIEDDTLEIKSDEMATDEHFDEKRKQKLLLEAIENLEGQQRAVFNMRFYDNLSYDEIAKILNKSVGGMKANYFHAVKKIEAYIKSKKDIKEIFSC